MAAPPAGRSCRRTCLHGRAVGPQDQQTLPQGAEAHESKEVPRSGSQKEESGENPPTVSTEHQSRASVGKDLGGQTGKEVTVVKEPVTQEEQIC